MLGNFFHVQQEMMGEDPNRANSGKSREEDKFEDIKF